MPTNLLISGPAGASKSGLAREKLAETEGPAVAADFQAIVAALLLLRRDPETGKYPERPEWVLPLAEHVRREVIDAARSRDVRVVATNSDGAPDRRRFLIERLGPGALEEVIDPGEQVCRARLSGRTGKLSKACEGAIRRWYSGARKR